MKKIYSVHLEIGVSSDCTGKDELTEKWNKGES